MKIRVKIDDVEVEIDRPKMEDYQVGGSLTNGHEWRTYLMNDSVIPMLTEATNKAKELYKLKNE